MHRGWPTRAIDATAMPNTMPSKVANAAPPERQHIGVSQRVAQQAPASGSPTWPDSANYPCGHRSRQPQTPDQLAMPTVRILDGMTAILDQPSETEPIALAKNILPTDIKINKIISDRRNEVGIILQD